MAVGLLFSLPLSLLEQSWTPIVLQPSWGLIAGLLFIALGPSLLAYRFWGLGVTQGGPAMAAIFANLTPLFAALMSAMLLGEPPGAHHGLAFLAIASGIYVSARRPAAGKP
jgi:drug/metabolite transporter (DMT)-like permease